MKKLVFFIALFLTLSIESRAHAADSLMIKKVNELATQVQKKYAPESVQNTFK